MENKKNTCSYYFDCCDCGGNDCGCGYCWSCKACEECINGNEDKCSRIDWNR